jgi:hypothetical protein
MKIKENIKLMEKKKKFYFEIHLIKLIQLNKWAYNNNKQFIFGWEFGKKSGESIKVQSLEKGSEEPLLIDYRLLSSSKFEYSNEKKKYEDKLFFITLYDTSSPKDVFKLKINLVDYISKKKKKFEKSVSLSDWNNNLHDNGLFFFNITSCSDDLFFDPLSDWKVVSNFRNLDIFKMGFFFF